MIFIIYAHDNFAEPYIGNPNDFPFWQFNIDFNDGLIYVGF